MTRGIAVDPRDLRHLLLSVDDRARSDHDREALDGVVRRIVDALRAASLTRPIHVRPACTTPLHVEGVPGWIFETNSWILVSPRGQGRCIVIDVPPSPTGLIARLAARGLAVGAVVVTHGHADHVGGVSDLLDTVDDDVPVFVPASDFDLACAPAAHGDLLARVMDLHGVPRARAVGVDDGTRLHVAGCDVEVMHTPGHTRGSTCLRVHGTARPLMCTGDVLERHTAARCDLVGGGSAVTQERSMASRIAVLDDDVVLLPGHGEVTTIGEERRRGMLTSAPA